MNLRARGKRLESGLTRASIALAVAIVVGLLVALIAAPFSRGSRDAGATTMTSSDYTYHCDSAGDIVGTFTFSPTPSTTSFDVS